jgi:hypothetical protein
MPPTTPPPGATFVVWLIVLVAVCSVMMVLFKVAVWWGERGTMSSSNTADPVRMLNEPVRAGGSDRFAGAVREPLNQVEPPVPLVREPEREPVILHNLSRASLIAVLAVQKTDTGGYRFSKNQIAQFVGGTKAEILKEIDLYREQPPTPRPSVRADRPVNGWGS